MEPPSVHDAGVHLVPIISKARIPVLNGGPLGCKGVDLRLCSHRPHSYLCHSILWTISLSSLLDPHRDPGHLLSSQGLAPFPAPLSVSCPLPLSKSVLTSFPSVPHPQTPHPLSRTSPTPLTLATPTATWFQLQPLCSGEASFTLHQPHPPVSRQHWRNARFLQAHVTAVNRYTRPSTEQKETDVSTWITSIFSSLK